MQPKNKAYSIKYLNLDTSHERSVVLFELLTGSERKNVDLDMLQEVEGVGVALAALAAADEAVVAAAEA